MISFPGCKVNIGLHILAKRPDGFHNIETLFYPLGFTDGLDIVQSDGAMEFTQSGLHLPGDQKSNLCIKAYELLKRDYDLSTVKIHLHKKIPPGSGLGGGSSDAANTLILLNELFQLDLSKDQLAGYARQLGADCAFFVYNKPLIGKERGDVFEETVVDLSGYHIVIIKPKDHVITSNAYGKVTPCNSRKPLKELVKQPVNKWRDTMVNDFEDVIFKEYPNIKNIKSTLYKKGAIYASMTGSGSAVYGIFEHEPKKLENVFGDYLLWREKV